MVDPARQATISLIPNMMPTQQASWMHLHSGLNDPNAQWAATAYQTPISLAQTNGSVQFNNRRQGQPGVNRTIMSGNQRQLDALKHFGSLTTYPQQGGNNNKRNKIPTTSKTNLYISGLSESDSDETVRALVEGVVEPKSSKAMMSSGKCRGSGFIDCVSEEDAEKAKKHILEYAKTKGMRLSVKYAFENEKDMLNVYVRNLPRVNFTKEDLERHFKEFGHVTSVKLLEGSNGGYTGTGFVRFSTPEEAQLAVDMVNQRHLVIDNDDQEAKPMVCKLADKTDPRRKQQRNSPNDLTSEVVIGHHHPQQQHPQHHPVSILSPVGAGFTHLGQPMTGTGGVAGPQNGLMQHPISITSLIPNLQNISLNGGASHQFPTSAANISPHANISMTNAAPNYQAGPQGPYYQAYSQPTGPMYQAAPPTYVYSGYYQGMPTSHNSAAAQLHNQQLNADAAHFIPQQGFHG